MIDKNFDKFANKIVNAFLKNKIISPIPSIYTKKISNAQKFRNSLKDVGHKAVSGISFKLSFEKWKH